MELRFAVVLSSVGLMVVSTGVVSGQDYPNRPIRIVTQAAGGGSDFTARIIAQGISGPLGQPVVVDNRSGTSIGPEIVAKSPPDGHTLLLQGASVWIGPLLRKVPFDPVRDFSPITETSKEVSILVVHPSVAANSVKELIALAKAKPGVLNYGSSGAGGTSHLVMELFKSMAGVNIVHVPYKATGPAVVDLLSGQVQVMINSAPALLPHIKSGKLRGLAVSSLEPSALVPGLPTISASGVPGYDAVGITGIWAPANTPGAIINRLHQEIVRVLTRPEVKEQFLSDGGEIVANTPAQFAAIIKSNIAQMSKVIKDSGLKVD